MSSASDSLRSIQRAQVVDAVCEGPIEGLVDGLQSIYLDGTPLQNADGSLNFSDVTPPTVRLGSQTQTIIPWVKGTESLVPVGQEVTNANPIERTITDPAVDAVRVTMLFPQLMKQESDGDLKGTGVSYRIEVKGASAAGFSAKNMDFAWQDVLGDLVSDMATRVVGSVTATVSLRRVDRDSVPTLVTALVSYRDTVSDVETTLPAISKMTDSSQVSGVWTGTVGSFDLEFEPGGATKQFSSSIGTLHLRQLVPVTEVVVSGKSSSAYQRSHLVRLPPGDAPWIVRVVRLTADSTDLKLMNKTFWESLTAIYEERLSYPHTALIGFNFNAKQFQSIPVRSYRLRLLRVLVPSNYDPIERSYDGDWDGTWKQAWTNNPVWCWQDLATNRRYGCGDYITRDMLDKWALYEMARYCDELVPDGYGSLEPRFTCNLYLQTREDAWKVLTNMAAIFRAMTFWSTGAVQLSQDRPRDPVYLFTNANVVDGQCQYQSSSIKTRHNVAMVAWNDPDEQYRQRVEYVDDAELIVRWGFVSQTEVVALGCTSRAQAYRVGRWLLYTERYETESVVFETGLEGQIPSPGDVIAVADQHRAGARIGGRLVDVPTATTLVLDQAVTITAGATIQVINDLGGVEERAITTAPGTTASITVASAWDVPPGAQSIWMMSTSILQPELYRVLSVAERGDGERFAITGVLYNPGKFAFVDDGAQLQRRDTSILGDPFAVPPAPAGLSATDAIYPDAAKVIRSRITLSWEPVPGQRFVRGYLVSYRLAAGGSWQEMQETASASVDILDVQDGQAYEMQVASVSQLGKRSTPVASITYTPVGKARPPADVASITATINAGTGQVDLAWPLVADIDVTLYEVRLGASWDAGAVIVTGMVNAATVPATGTTMTFWVKAKDAERYSDNAASDTVVIQVPAQPTVLAEVIDNNVLLRWTDAQQSLPVDYYEIRRGATFAAATVIGTKAGLFTTVFETAAGAYTYWVVGIDRAGNYGTPASVPAQVSAPPDYVLQLNQAITWATLTNAYNEAAGALLPVNTTETFQAHFTANAWASPQAQVTAGFPVYAQPGLSSGSVAAVVDAGATLASSRITVNFTAITVSGSPSATCTISVSNTSSTGPWTDFVGTQSVYATAFRWCKVTIAVTGGLARIASPSLRMDVKEKTDSGEVAAVSTDSGGTTVTFVQSFSSVKSITLTPKGTAARIAIYDFAGGVNPTTFKVLLFDATGARVSGQVSWKATGV